VPLESQGLNFDLGTQFDFLACLVKIDNRQSNLRQSIFLTSLQQALYPTRDICPQATWEIAPLILCWSGQFSLALLSHQATPWTLKEHSTTTTTTTTTTTSSQPLRGIA